MVHSNEIGRALEYKVAIELENFINNELKIETISTETTNKLNFRHKIYFDDLNEPTKQDFSLCATTLIKWLKNQNWFELADHVTIDRFGDEKATQSLKLKELANILQKKYEQNIKILKKELKTKKINNKALKKIIKKVILNENEFC